MAGLADGLAFRAPDLPGHGSTDPAPAGEDAQSCATADALRLLDDRPPAHLVGHSFGGTVALRLVTTSPGHVASLTLIEPVQFSLLAAADHPGYAGEMAAQQPFRQSAEANDWPAAIAAFLARWGAPGGAEALPAAQRAAITSLMPLVAAMDGALYDRTAARPTLADLATIRCPVLLIGGADSPPAIGQILDVIAARIPQARRVTLRGAGHMAPLTHARDISDLVRNFLGFERREKPRHICL